jgi:hypothetical protein
MIDDVMGYVSALKHDFSLWLMYIPAMVIQHKTIVFTTYHNFLSRIQTKKKMVILDYVTLAVSTFISSIFVICIPLFFIFITKDFGMSEELFVSLLFFIARYTILGIFIQYIIYTILFVFPRLQKKNGGICLLPFALYFIFIAPMDFLAANDEYVPFLDFSSGKYYVFATENSVLWESIIMYNIHLIGYLFLVIWISINYISKRWEFENASNTAY